MTASPHADDVEALEEYVQERPWGYRTAYAERLIGLLHEGQSPEEAMDTLELEAWRTAERKVTNRQRGLNSSLENTLDELRSIMRG